MITLSKKYFIYVLRHPVTGAIFYVGKTNNPPVRLRAHLYERMNAAKYEFIKSLPRKPVMEVIDEYDCEESALSMELFYIDEYNRNGCVLLNGGDGRFTPEEVKIRQQIMLTPTTIEIGKKKAAIMGVSFSEFIEIAINDYNAE